MKLLITLATLMFSAHALADASAAPATSPSDNPKPVLHHYLVERTFPPGALKGLDAATKAAVNAKNASVGVRWIRSYANAGETKTFCLYDGPSEAAIRRAAELNKLPVDSITEIPVTLTSK